jgi:hypothetical protein
MTEDKFDLRDDEYWSDPWRTRKTIQRPMMQKNQEGLVLGAPAIVPLNQRQNFPVALLRVGKLTTLGKIPSRPNVIITAMDLSTGELRARLALPDVGRPSNGTASQKPPAGRDSFSADATAMVGEGHTIDLASRLQLPAARGEHLVTAILLDQVSNRCRMKLVESGGFEDPAVDDFLREYRASRLPPPAIFPEPALPLPSYRKQENSPASPVDPGLALSVTRVSVLAPNARCVLAGSYRLPIQPQHVVKVVKFTRDANGQTIPHPETAIVPITLLLTGSVEPEPKILRLAAPSYAPLESATGGTVATGYFSLDLCRLTNLLATPQTYFIYAFSGEAMTAAVPTAFVRLPEESLDSVQSW